MTGERSRDDGDAVAVVGMACRLPGSPDIGTFWRNLRSSTESISFFAKEDLAAWGVDRALLDSPDYVRAGGVLDGIDRFDASYFGIPPKEAALTDPQHRVFLECVVTALEDAGLVPDQFDGTIGLYAGTGFNSYLLEHLLPNSAELRGMNTAQLLAAADKDYLTTRVSYKLGLTGPSLTVQTACSSSLVAVHLACESLLSWECDAALAGGVSIGVGQGRGYLYQPGGIMSPDGHCRPFDAAAAGTVFGSGVGVVVLKRLTDAIADGDAIDAVILGSAVNNDGREKAGYTAPSVRGQAAVISLAHRLAGVSPDDVSYVEAHGTATRLGDSIEIAALARAFHDGGWQGSPCAIGAVKSNVGHLDTCAGIAGLIKTALALRHAVLPATLHFQEVNPELAPDAAGFDFLSRLQPWRPNGDRRVAGVSSFGIGGTNAHVVVAEAPARRARGGSRDWEVLPVSARTTDGLRATVAELARSVSPGTDVGDVARVLQTGRAPFAFRDAIVRRSGQPDLSAWHDRIEGTQARTDPPVVLMFPSKQPASSHLVEFCHQEPIFRDELLRCAALADLAEPDPERIGQPSDDPIADALALFVTEYSTARWLRALGVRSIAVLGTDIGRYTAAAISGTISEADAIRLIRTSTSPPPGFDVASALPTIPKGAIFIEAGQGRILCDAVAAVDSSAVLIPLFEPGTDEVPTWLAGIAALWRAGVDIAWAALGEPADRFLIHLPARAFEPTRHWLDRPESGTARTDRGALRRPTWTVSECQGEPLSGPILMFGADDIADELEAAGRAVIRVSPGTTFAADGDRFRIQPDNPDDYTPLLDTIRSHSGSIHQIVYGWQSISASATALAAAQSAVTRAMFLARALAARQPGERCEILFLTRSAISVDADIPTCPWDAALTGPALVIPEEYGWLRCRLVDVESGVGIGVGRIVAAELADLAAGGSGLITGWRGNRRMTRSLTDIDTQATGRPIRVGGIYLITGGTGGVGGALARGLAEAGAGAVILLSRSGKVSGSLKTDLLAHDVEIVSEQVDVSDPDALAAVLARARDRFGRIDGVIHAAGIPGGGVIHTRSVADVEAVLRPKVAGADNLVRLVPEGTTDFLVFCSSTIALTGQAGQIDYCAANAYLDALAHTRADLTSVNWHRWRDVGMAADSIPATWVEQATPDHPLFDRLRTDQASAVVAHRLSSGTLRWLADEHVVAGVPVLPGTALVECVAAAAERALGAMPVSIRDVVFIQPVPCDADEVTVKLTPRGAGFHWEVLSEPGAVCHAEGIVSSYPGVAPKWDLERLRSLGSRLSPARSEVITGAVRLGPRWQCVTDVLCNDDTILLELALPTEYHGDLQAHIYHPALLDMATGAAAALTTDGMYLPVAYRSIVLYRPLPTRLFSRVTSSDAREHSGHTMVFDVDIMTTDGECVGQVTGFTLRRLAEKENPNAATGRHPPVIRRRPFGAGLSSDAGVAAFIDVLSLGDSRQVAVLPENVSWPTNTARDEHHPAPTRAHGTLLEDIVAVWSRLLGVDVEPDDDLYDLGADSLLIVQFASAASEYGITVAPSDVFAARTATELAVLVAETTKPADAVSERIGTPTTDVVLRSDLPSLHLEDRPLISLHAVGDLADVDGAAFAYLPDQLLSGGRLTAAEIANAWCHNMPVFNSCYTTAFGRIAVLSLPRFTFQLYEDRTDLLHLMEMATNMAARLGARTVSLTGLLPSATDYGSALAQRLADVSAPAVTTGHATTAASVAMSVLRSLDVAGRSLAGATLAVVGVGSIGTASLRLLLNVCDQPPALIVLADVAEKTDALSALSTELRASHGLQVRTVTTTRDAPDAVYSATVIIGATNMPGVIDVDRLLPGTILIDDSYPHSFDTSAAFRRLDNSCDILFTEAGLLRSPTPIDEVRYFPRTALSVVDDRMHTRLAEQDVDVLTACILSSIISTTDDIAPLTVGPIDLSSCLLHYRRLSELGFTAPTPRCDGRAVSDEQLAGFRSRYGSDVR